VNQRPLRVSFVLPDRGLSGGIRVVVIHANRLIERGHQVAIVYPRRPWPRNPRRLLRRLYNEGRRWTGRDRDHIDTFTGFTVVTSQSRSRSAVPDGDMVFATHWLTADLVADLPPRKGRKAYFLQSYEAHSFDPEKVDATWRLPLQKFVVARWLQDLAREKFGDASAVWVPNGVDRSQFDAPPRGLHSPRSIGFVYSPASVKNPEMALEVHERVRRRFPDLQLISFGAARPTLVHRAVPNMTFFRRPPQETLRDIYASADVWLCSSGVEGFGLPLLEAMACRCPVVTTRCGGVVDFVRDGQNGFLVDVGDAEGMADAVIGLLSDPQRWDRASQAAYATRLEFTWERSSSLFEAALTPQTKDCHGYSSNADAVRDGAPQPDRRA
jgi:glycosyltransferase involved in cell wall biosynthesis